MTMQSNEYADYKDREANRERIDRQIEAMPAGDETAYLVWLTDRAKRRSDVVTEMLPALADEWHLKDILGVHFNEQHPWSGPVADAFKAFARQMLADVQERLKPGREKIDAINQERYETRR